MKDHQYNERHHNWALDLKDNLVHISKAESGKRGYYCIGCKREMVAVVNFKDPSHKQYYRHDVVSEHEAKCTYSDETTRHKIAKEILQRLGEIKVPAIYSYPPAGAIGKPNLISKERYIKAHTIRTERYFYEDENGQIRWGDKTDSEVEGRNYLIKPDVIFLDKEGQPILFIELVAKHKISDEKKVKIRRLGIDTLQVKLPAESQEEIERTFTIVERTKWVYNYEQESTEYVPVSKAPGEAVPPVDELQGALLEETYSCRTAEIRNLLFAIGRCLESESYRRIEDSFRGEISRVTNNTETERERERGIRRGAQETVASEFKGAGDQLGAEEAEVGEQEEGFRRYAQDLEGRYHKKRSELEGDEAAFRKRIEREAGEEEFGGDDVETRQRKLREQAESIERHIVREREAIRRIEAEVAEIPERVGQQEAEYRAKTLELEARETATCESIRKSIAELPARFEFLRGEIDREQAERSREDADRIKARDGSGSTELSRSIKGILEDWRLIDDYKNEFVRAKRYKRAYECLKQGRFKTWPEYRRICRMDGSKQQ